jgi:hypothetical protein
MSTSNGRFPNIGLQAQVEMPGEEGVIRKKQKCSGTFGPTFKYTKTFVEIDAPS